MGGCKEQIEKLKEVVEMPLLHVSVKLLFVTTITHSLVYKRALNTVRVGEGLASLVPCLHPIALSDDVDA